MHDDAHDWQRLERYFAGECDPQEAAAVRRWIEVHPARREIAEALGVALARTDALARGEVPSPAWDVDLAWSAMCRVSATTNSMSGRPDPRNVHPWPRRVGRASSRAALAALAVAIAVCVGVIVGVHRTATGPEAPGREYATVAGQRLSVTLVDGTQVTLAPASRLRVRPDYGRATRARALDLEGEAYFAVAHDAQHPFTVRALNVEAYDVGTAFDVRAYAGDSAVRVAVTEGVVSLRPMLSRGAPIACAQRPVPAVSVAVDHCTITLPAGDVATVSPAGAALVTRGTDLAALTSWTSGRFAVTNLSLADAARELSRWYDLDIRITDTTLAARRVSGTAPSDSLSVILSTLARAIDARVERNGRTITLTPHVR